MDDTGLRRIRVIVKVFGDDSSLEDNEEEEDEQLIECGLLRSENNLNDPLQLPSSYEDRGKSDPLATPEDGKSKSKSPRRKGQQISQVEEKEVGLPIRTTRVSTRRMCTSTCSPSPQSSSFSFQNSSLPSTEDQVKKEEIDDDADDAGCVHDDKDPDYLPPQSVSDKGKRRLPEKEENEEVPKKSDWAKERAQLSEADKEKVRQRENARRKQRRAMETPAEREERRRKARVSRQKLSKTEILDERERERMQFLRSKMTPEQKKERSRKNMERRKLRYAQMTPEQKEEQSRKNMEQRRQRYAQMTPEERREIRRKDNVNSFFRKEAEKAALTKEEWEQQEFQRKMHNYMQYVARRARFTPEEWTTKERRRRKEEYARLPEEKKEKRRQVTRKYFQNLPEEKRMEYQKGNMARMKLYYKKVKETNQAKWKVMQHKLNEYQRKQTAKETPEQRQKRLLRYKVYQAKRKAKLKMEEEGVPPEEIERRLVEVVRQVEEKDRLEREKKPVDPAEYKPREAARKPKKKNLPQLETLPEEEEQNDNSSNFSCALPQQPNASLVVESSTQVNNVVEESVTRDNPVAAASVQDSYSEPCSPAALGDDAECFSDFEQSPNSSYPTTVNLDNFEERKPKKKNVQQFETPTVSAELTEQPSPRKDSCSSTQANNVAVAEESVILDNSVAAKSLIDSYSEPCSPAAFQDDEIDKYDQYDDSFSGFVPRLASSAPSPAKLDNSETNNAQEIECASGTAPTQENNGGGLERKIISSDIECSPVTEQIESANSVPTSLNVEAVSVEAPPSSEQSGSSPVEALEDVPTENKILKEEDRVICDECGKCLNRGSIREHKHLLHNLSANDFKCPKCEKCYSSARALWDHYLVVHEETLPNSTDHDKNLKTGRTTVPAEVEKAKKPRVYGRNGPFICEECGRVYREKANLNAHVRIAHQEQRFICEGCGKEEQSGGKLWRHKVAKHPGMDAPPPEGTVICEYCAEPILRHYQNHVKTAHPEKYEEYKKSAPVPVKATKKHPDMKKKSKCTECNKEIGTHEMKRHMRNVHGHKPKTFPCQQCAKNFKENYHLQQHIRVVHTFETFDRKVQSMKLIRQEVDEDGLRILFCSICDEKLFTRKHMRSHLISSHLEVYEKVKNGEVVDVSAASPWNCGACSESFSTEQLFYSHVHSSHPTTKYYCSQSSCHKLFNGRVSLRAHHRKEHPHAKFLNPLLHEGGTYRNYQKKCPQCNMNFRTKPRLLEHVKSLHPESYWLCPHCELFIDKQNQLQLDTHLSECRRNPEVKRKKKKEAVKRKKGKKERMCETDEECDSDHEDGDDDGSDEDDATCEPPDEIGTRRSSRIKAKKTPKKVKVKVKRDEARNDHKLDMEVKVIVVRLTTKEIDYYTMRK